MGRTARFVISRISKDGNIDIPRIIAALTQSISILSRKFAWTIVNVQSDQQVIYRNKVYPFVSGLLVKYDPDAVVGVVNEATRQVELQPEPNMERAASLFVYFPGEALFVHRHVWNEVRPRDFRIQLAGLIKAFYGDFFVECELQPLADYSRFVNKLAALDEVTELKARVRPPNPLFSIFWSDLKKYVENRRLSQFQIKEIAKSNSTVPTQVPELARQIESNTVQQDEPAVIGDAAILMAADGYGTAEVTGRRGAQVVVVKTAENAIQMIVEADISANELAARAAREIARQNRSRRLRH
jgi:hypothetical protein